MKVQQWIGSLFGVLCFSTTAQAQSIQSDGLLNTVVSSSDGRNFAITNGTAANSNLFHSFRDFSIPTGGSATFDLTNAAQVRTIFSRVTGNTMSNIDGVLQTMNNANPVSVFLMNPNGILFGSNARLNINGSFIGTTATSLRFADGTEFSAVNQQSPDLLTISAPIGLQFGSSAPIALQGSGHRLTAANPVFAPLQATQPNPGLTVPFGHTIALIGGDLSFNGGVVTAPQGRVELGGVRQGYVGLDLIPQGFALNYDRVSDFGNIQLSNRSLIDVNGINAGAIQVYARQISLDHGSVLWTQNRGVQTTGEIKVSASELLSLNGTAPDLSVRTAIVAESVGMGGTGNLEILTPRLFVQDGAGIAIRTYGRSDSGSLTVNANQFEVSGFSAIAPSLFSAVGTFTYANGNAGDVRVSAQQLSVLNGGYLGTSTAGTGFSGSLFIHADDIAVSGTTPLLVGSIIASASLGLGGNGRSITLNTRRLQIRDSGLVAASSIGIGSAGSVTVNAAESIEISGGVPGTYVSSIGSAVDLPNPDLQRIFGISASIGNAGNITINTPQLTLTHGGAISVVNNGIGSAGTLRIQADRISLAQRGEISAFTRAGEGGNIEIQSNLLQLRRSSLISATAQGQGDGGSIQLSVPVIVGLENSDMVANAIDGRGGNINITTQAILGLKYRTQLTPESDITASSQFGVNGTVQITTPAINPNAGLIELPISLIDPNQQVANRCASGQGDRFVISGRGGLPANPLEHLHADRTWADLRNLAPDRREIASPRSSPLIEAATWYRNAQGKVVLSAGQTPRTSIATCALAN